MTERDAFIDYIWASIADVSQYTEKTPEQMLALLAFDILAALDGEAADVPGYELRPLSPDGTPGDDIAGDLHGNFYRS